VIAVDETVRKKDRWVAADVQISIGICARAAN